jgi:uncharacterized radical SAM superfamily Fe-S cluster-containing enzyme
MMTGVSSVRVSIAVDRGYAWTDLPRAACIQPMSLSSRERERVRERFRVAPRSDEATVFLKVDETMTNPSSNLGA